MNDYDNYLPALPDDGGAVTPYSPGADWLPASAPAGPAHVPDLSQHGLTAAPTMFGQQLPIGTPHEAAQRNLDALIGHFQQAAYQQGVPQHYFYAARAWFQQAARAPAPNDLPAHPYRLYGFNFSAADTPLVNSFTNAMWGVRAPEAVVQVFLRAYAGLVDRLQQAQQPQQQPHPSFGFTTIDDLSDAEYAALEQRSQATKRVALDDLRALWGSDYQSKLRVVRQYFAGLPSQDRDFLETSIVRPGVIAADHPEIIDSLYRQAIGPLPTGGALQAEIAQLEQRMRTDRKAWNRDERAQLRLRALYEQRDG